MYAILLAQSVEDPIVSDIEYEYDDDDDNAVDHDANGTKGHPANAAAVAATETSSAALLAAESAIDLNGLMAVFNPMNWFRGNSNGNAGDGSNDTAEEGDLHPSALHFHLKRELKIF